MQKISNYGEVKDNKELRMRAITITITPWF
jgi:hypothetical protein